MTPRNKEAAAWASQRPHNDHTPPDHRPPRPFPLKRTAFALGVLVLVWALSSCAEDPKSEEAKRRWAGDRAADRAADLAADRAAGLAE